MLKTLLPSPPAPDDHFAAGRHCRFACSSRGRVGGAGGCPTVGAGIISPAGVQARRYFRPRRSSGCQSIPPCDPHRARRVLVRASWLPGLYLPPCSIPYPADQQNPPPHNHCCQSRLPCEPSGRGRVGEAGGYPTVGPGWYLPPVFRPVYRPPPDDHLTAVESRLPCASCVQRARWLCLLLPNYWSRDCISRQCCRSLSAPDYHFTAGPHCRVIRHVVGALVMLVAVQLLVPGLFCRQCSSR